MTTLTDAQLTKLAEKIFIMRAGDTTRLPKPVTTATQPYAEEQHRQGRWTG
jgi:hypothetical protein